MKKNLGKLFSGNDKLLLSFFDERKSEFLLKSFGESCDSIRPIFQIICQIIASIKLEKMLLQYDQSDLNKRIETQANKHETEKANHRGLKSEIPQIRAQ